MKSINKQKIIASALALALITGMMIPTTAVVGAAAVNEETTISGSAKLNTNGDYTYNVLDNGTLEITKYTGNDTKVTIPSKIDGKKVTGIANNAFAGCGSLKSVTIPGSVTSLGYSIFQDCSSLTSINVSSENNNYCSINGVLFNKNKTELICYPAGKTGAYTIPDSVTSIEWAAFYGCCSLTDVTIPKGVTDIKMYAFAYCSSLKSVIIPNSVKNIGGSTFYGCTSLEMVMLPSSVTNIGWCMFYGCTSLKGIMIPNSVERIGDWAFYNCSSLTIIKIPSSVTSIEFEPFYGCDSLTIYGEEGSVAEKYANDNGITFKFTNADSLLKNNSEISKTTIDYGDSIKITGKATGSKPPYQYSFLYKPSTSGAWMTLTSYDTISTIVWTPETPGTYTVRTQVKASTGKEAIKDFTLTVKSPLENNSTLSKTTINKGDSITITGEATGGTSPYQYSFLCKHSTSDSWSTLTSYGTKSTIVWTPAKSDTYTVRTKVKDSTGKEAVKDFTLIIKSPLENNSTLSKTTINKGDSIKITGKATGDRSPYYYSFLYKHSTSNIWSVLTSYGEKSTIIWTPEKSGTYTVRTKVQGSTGKAVIKDFTLTVKLPLTNNSTISDTDITVGTPITLKAKATGGTAPYKYYYYCKAPNSTKYVQIKTDEKAASRITKPTVAGTYYYSVKIVDANGNYKTKIFTVKVNSALTNNSTISATNIRVGTAITLKSRATGGTAPYKYYYYCKAPNSTKYIQIKADEKAASRITKPTVKGTYNYCINIVDANGVFKIKIFTVTVK